MDTPTIDATSLAATCIGDGSSPATAAAVPEENNATAVMAAARCGTRRPAGRRVRRLCGSRTWVVEMRRAIAATVGDPHAESSGATPRLTAEINELIPS